MIIGNDISSTRGSRKITEQVLKCKGTPNEQCSLKPSTI